MVGPQRLDDWPERLNDFLGAAHGRLFLWGKWDCCLFSADAVLAMTGIDVGVVFRGKYTTAVGAARAVKRYGGGTLEDAMDKMAAQNRWLSCLPLMAKRGDVVLVGPKYAPGRFGGAMGIVRGADIACVTEDGLVSIPLDSAVRAWSIV